MAKKNDDETVREHYIPQFYLKQFSPNKKIIYQYNVFSDKASSILTSTTEVCFEKNLYEYRDDKGEIVNKNLIEKRLSVFEAEFASVFQSIHSKAAFKQNHHTSSFLSTREKILLVFFISTLLSRDPKVIQLAKECAIEELGELMDDTTARNLALNICLPVHKALDTEERTLLKQYIQALENMSFQIGIAEKDVFWTSDHPAIVKGVSVEGQAFNIEQVSIPLSSRIALLMKPYEKVSPENYNRLVILGEKEIRAINAATVTNCYRWIYSKAPLTEKQIQWIKKQRK